MDSFGSNPTTVTSSSSSSLLQLYRRDRRKLLEFILAASGSIRESDDVDVDELRVDSVIDCVKAGIYELLIRVISISVFFTFSFSFSRLT